MNYQDKEIVVIGLGITGLSCVMFFLRQGVIPRVMDTRKNPPTLAKLPSHIKYCLEELNEKWVLAATLIVVSPGVSLYHPVLVTAAHLGIEIIGDIELFVREVTKPIVAITGTNGKSTVTRLVGEMAFAAGLRVGIGGNIGRPALTLLNDDYQLYILELSSFQLETTFSLKAAVAIILNISNEHVNRYPFGLQQYRDVKLKIYEQASSCVVNALDVLTFPRNDCEERCIYFGNEPSGHYIKFWKGQAFLMLHNEILFNCKDLRIIGYHNYTNVLAALVLADVLSISRTVCLSVLQGFIGLAHRFELIHNKNGVQWINDSKSTNIASTQVALRSLVLDGIIHLLLGGDAKSADFSSLKSWVQRDNISLYCFGKDGKYLSMLRSNNVILTDTMEQAVRIVGSNVRTGDVVLLSPACSSLDQFKNFELRGKIFTNLAKEVG
ncbi:UDP-N-acetylmuramoyl-L-alanine--D-glutamate ligase [Blochmannia endosymbiont of Camponotus (Colobopsis) obliquus]|uniref:UDP-N-acetylmuramoyl-L-alanine--D-glutamate ligase n=1 Tax=Blochmannia endosymbiont of Camponotus (Colobopsis) obliquus TaxID=1505597 RepID=UPI00061A52EF|nr:UDP-N-acetylmuramoyl-L-alanine--D-glutamate ligase [Blochmannia endosymbiont of Camponotus (Colobopsis) obliquus]AKC60315.1 UDP-N-acetylmuramoylalanine--D-glutamate ligase [Blochmannia endosymbiont of Camponotus (Colobopsis) obliquus]